MTWFSKTAAFCTALVLLGFTLDVLARTLWNCQQDCKNEPDDPVCGRWNHTSDSGQRNKLTSYIWLRNECERKCFSRGDYKRVEDMELCYKHGQSRHAYLCSDHMDPVIVRRCIRNESLEDPK